MIAPDERATSDQANSSRTMDRTIRCRANFTTVTDGSVCVERRPARKASTIELSIGKSQAVNKNTFFKQAVAARKSANG